MHLMKDKLSQKMGRRDIQFYDLYKLKKPEEYVTEINSKGLPLDGILTGTYVNPQTNEEEYAITDENEHIYGDIEVDDFNKLFRNADLIEDQFGESIKVKL